MFDVKRYDHHIVVSVKYSCQKVDLPSNKDENWSILLLQTLV